MTAQLDYQTMHEVFRRFAEREPVPKGELEHVNAYTLVVAVALSAQATDKGVNAATREKDLAWIGEQAADFDAIQKRDEAIVRPHLEAH